MHRTIYIRAADAIRKSSIAGVGRFYVRLCNQAAEFYVRLCNQAAELRQSSTSDSAIKLQSSTSDCNQAAEFYVRLCNQAAEFYVRLFYDRLCNQAAEFYVRLFYDRRCNQAGKITQHCIIYVGIAFVICLFVCDYSSSSSGWRYDMNGNSDSCRQPN